jgi:hypothetical protein
LKLQSFKSNENLKLIFAKVLIIAVPSFGIAFVTEKIHFIVPTIAMCLMIANSLEDEQTTFRNRLEEEEEETRGEEEDSFQMKDVKTEISENL